jgi:hypothetical protein
MMQTAVEWLVNQVEDFIGLIPVDIIEQAKAMEKEQIIKAHYDGGCDFHEAKELRNQEVPYVNEAEQYYIENYETIRKP